MKNHLDHPTGSLLLCDITHQDRGKLNILGGAWTSCPPGPRDVRAVVQAAIPLESTERSQHVKLEICLWLRESFRDGEETPLVSTEIEGDAEIQDEHSIAVSFIGDVGLHGELAPETSYVVTLHVNGHLAAVAPFDTVPWADPS